MVVDHLVQIAVFLVIFGVVVDCSTLYTGRPLLRTPPEEHRSDSDDYFGYSATLHNTIDPQDGSPTFQERIDSGRVIVGVPQGTPMGGAVSRTGYVVECPLTPGNCQPMRGDSSGDDLLLYDTAANRPAFSPFTGNTSREGLFLGGKVKSSGRFFMTCGHRFVFETFRGSIQGYCLLSGRSLQEFEFFSPCSSNHSFNLQISLPDQTPSDIQNSNIYLCMAGTNIVFKNNDSFVVSAPGAQSSQRGGYIYTTTSPLPNDTSGFVLNIGLPTDQELQYAGYSMTYGDITGQSAQNLILGVPRAREGFGAVIVTREMLSSPNSNFNIREPTGQIGTYFGQSVAAVDFNGDGFDELLVGAPLYFESPSIPEIGAVYVYTRDDMFTAPRTTLKGTGNLRQFGYAIAAMGDLNFDTYEDVAISAPYGASGSSQAGGTVIIYFGGSGGIVTTPAQIIVGRELNLLPSLVSGVEAFGVSISGDTDVDGNCYNDLVIGAFESRQVFVLRSRTVAVIETTVTSSVASLRISATGDKPCHLGNKQYDCFNVTYSFSVTGKCFTAGQMFNVSYTLYGDRAAGQSSRVILDESQSTEKRGSVVLTLGTSSQSFNETIYIVNPETIYQIAITPTIVATIPQEPNPSASDGNTTLEDLSTTRIFARQQPSPASVQVLGLRDCADPANCISDLNITAFGIEFNVAAADGLNTLLLGSASTANISMTLDVGPNQDNAYGVCVDISDHPGLQYTSTSQVIGFDRCSAVGGNTQCCIFAPLLKGTQRMVSVSYNILDAGFTNRTAIITLLAKLGAGSVDPNKDNNRRDIEFNVSPSTDVQSRIEFLPSREVTVGERSRSGLPTTTEQLGQAFTVRFTYTNSGPGEVTAANLVLSLPYRSACTQQAFLYYISEVRPMQSSLSCRVDPPGAVNALNISASSSSTGASLPDVPGVCDTSVTTIQITCGPPEVQCVTVTCNVSRFMVRQQLSVEVVGYLDEYFYFNSGNHYTLQVQSDFNIQGDLKDPTPNDIRDTLSITNPNIFTPSEPVPWWAIVVPIVVAILLIIALIVILYLCGFFKRKRSWTPEEDELTNEEGNPQGEGEENENGNENGNENDENRNENENVTSAPDSVIGSTEAVV